MGAIFGYCGRPLDGLLERMATLLSHRCRGGWERVDLPEADRFSVAIGRGRAPWTNGPQAASNAGARRTFAHSGVIFNPGSVVAEPTGDAATDLMNGLSRNPGPGLAALEGAFAGVLVVDRTLWLVRDPAGIKVVYWTRHRKRLVFASEVKALFADPEVPRRMRPAGLAEYLTFSYVPGERTMFEGIFELQPGKILTHDGGTPSVRRHFAPEAREWTPNDRRQDAAFIEGVREDLAASVREACRAAVRRPPAVFLSGGIDSSAVLALAAREYPETPLRTFSVHFGRRYANENEFVSMMVERCRTRHTWLEIRPRGFLKRLREIIWRLDDPIGDPITVPNYLLAEAGARVADVVLNGEGGDPCFGGPKNIPMMLARIYGRFPGEPEGWWLERQYLLSYRKCFSDLARILSPDILAAAGGEAGIASIITPFFQDRRPAAFLNRLMAANIRLKGANLILVKVDKMTSANGLLALAPLFSRRIIEASMACPPRLKLMGSVEKGVLKAAMLDLLPRPIIDRPKSGMMVPVRFWMQGEMRRYARRLLSKRNLARVGFFNAEYVRKLLDYDRSDIWGSRHGLKIWMLVTFMLWHEQMVEGKNTP